MKFEERLKLAYEYLDKHCYASQEKDDIKQDVALYLWQHDTDNIAEVCEKVKRARLADESKHQRNRAQSLYNDDGECIDDEIYYVDDSTVEYNEEKSPVTDEQREEVAEMVTTLEAIDKLWQNYSVDMSKRKIKVEKAKKLALKTSSMKGNNQWTLKGLIKNSLNSWSGLQTLSYQRMIWRKKSKDPRQWLC